MPLRQFFKVRDNLIGFDINTLAEAVKKGKLVHIKDCDRLAKRGKRRGDVRACNAYFIVKGLYNTVYMHVQDGYGVIIPKYVYNEGKKINVVKRLARYYWAISTDNEKIKASSLGYRTVYRVIWSLVVYGDETVELPTCWHVHHKGYRWWNEIEATVVVCKAKHARFHEGNGTSHQSGVYLDSVSELDEFIKALRAAKPIAKAMKM